jgi:hypothetical protein
MLNRFSNLLKPYRLLASAFSFWTVFISFSAPSCKKIDSFTQFELPYQAEVTIASSTGIGLPITLFTPKIESNTESVFASNSTRKDLIESIVLQKLVLAVKSPSDGHFNFLDGIEVYIRTEQLPEVLLAWKNDIPNNNSRELTLNTTEEDIQAYIKADEFRLNVKTTTDELITRDHVIDIQSVFFVDAKLIGD